MIMNVHNFLAQKNIAVVGVSNKKKKFGNYIFEKLNDEGYSVFAVNPNTDENTEIKFYKSVNDLGIISAIVFVTKPNVTNSILREGIPINVKNIWVQQGAGNEETKLILSSMDVEFVFNKCLMMFIEPVKGIHKFHRTINRIFRIGIN